MDQGQELALALVSANLLSKTPEIYGKSPDEDAERSFEHLIDVALAEAPAGVVRELARFAGTAVTMLAFRAGVRPLEFIEGMASVLDPDSRSPWYAGGDDEPGQDAAVPASR